jgi:DNA-directed RNA polymerase subunit H (RpoH/RPB5)
MSAERIAAARRLMKKLGLKGFNIPKRTPNHPTKSHMVMAKEGDKIKLIRYGEQGASTAGAPKPGESKRMKMKRKSFKSRHARNIARGKMSAAFWADKTKWS